MKKNMLIIVAAVFLSFGITGGVYATDSIHSAALPPVAEPQHQSRPTDVWNFQNKGDYEIERDAYDQTMYSAYNFTGATAYIISLTNHSDHTQTIKFCRTSDDKVLDTIKIPANESELYTFECSNVWYLEITYSIFQGDTEVSGSISASAT
ncbi:MAG: hypothetical protein IJX14_07250 [Clostridia bacterium]|nr:hypothetical protein [Clostridia bacterium]